MYRVQLHEICEGLSSNFGDQVIHGLHLKANLDTCGLTNSSNFYIQMLKYVKKGYLQQHLEISDNAELCKQVFFSQPKAHQIKYVQKHCIVEDDILKLQEVMQGCIDIKICNSKYKRVIEGKWKVKEDAKAKESLLQQSR